MTTKYKQKKIAPIFYDHSDNAECFDCEYNQPDNATPWVMILVIALVLAVSGLVYLLI